MSNGTHDPALSPARDADRFSFGENWLRYVETIDDEPVRKAERSLQDLLRVEHLKGRTFLDIGSGSGLFSLAARRLGAHVRSFDFDPNSVRATMLLRDRYYPGDPDWQIDRGSVLDTTFVNGLGTFDVVYSWGVLHHTGDMWRALAHAATTVKPGGTLAIAIYNHQGVASSAWWVVKRTYNALPPSLRFLVLWPAFIRLWGPSYLRDLLRGRPGETWKRYGAERGMSPMIDVIDWVGGYPFEYATPAQITDFFTERGFSPVSTVLRSGIGCNEFVFERVAAADTRDCAAAIRR